MGKLLPLIRKADPEVEALMRTSSGTDSLIDWFIKQGFVSEEEKQEWSLQMKKDFIRIYVNDLERRKRESLSELAGFDLGKKN